MTDTHSKSLAAHIKLQDRIIKFQSKKIEQLNRVNGDLTKLVSDIFQDSEFYSTPVWHRLRMDTFERFGNNCAVCGKGPGDGVTMHIDHIKPKSLHPELALEPNNLQVLCETCNLAKGNRYQTDWRNA